MATTTSKKKTKASAVRVIIVSVDAGGVIHYKENGTDATHLSAEPRDVIKWRGPSHALGILFPDGSPFDDVIFGSEKGRNTAQGTVLPGEGTFKYAVLAVDSTAKVFTDDPDIIVT